VLLEQLHPPGERAGDGDRVGAAPGDRLVSLGDEHVGIGRAPGPAARVEAAKLLHLRVVDEREHVAADAGHRRFDHREDGGGGDRGIDRIAAFLHHLQSRRGCERLARGNDAVAREHRRACAARIAGRAIAGKLGGEDGHRTAEEQRDRRWKTHVILRGAGARGARGAR
jgi:hypothetical protein